MVDVSKVYMDTNYKLHYPPGATHMDNFPEELREVVHDHWGQFPPQHPLVVDMFGIFFLFLTFVCLFGNGLVIYIFLFTKSLRTPVSSNFTNFEILRPFTISYFSQLETKNPDYFREYLYKFTVFF